MGDTGKATPGAPLRIPASTWNTLVEVARRQEGLPGQDGDPVAPGVVLVRNDCGADVDRFGVLIITGLVFERADNAKAFDAANNWVFRADKAGEVGTSGGTLVITQEPIASGKIGLAMIRGLTPVKVDVAVAGQDTAGPISGETGKLQAGGGSIRLVYVESGTGSGKWGVVQLPIDKGIRYAQIITCELATGYATIQFLDGNAGSLALNTDVTAKCHMHSFYKAGDQVVVEGVEAPDYSWQVVCLIHGWTLYKNPADDGSSIAAIQDTPDALDSCTDTVGVP